MNNITLREFRETDAKYKKLRKRLDKRIKTGSFYQLTKKKQRNLVYRVRKLYEKLLRLKNLLKLATAGATMSLLLLTGQADAQKIPGKFPFKKEFKTSNDGVKAYESDIFVQMTGPDNPFGGTNPFSGNIISNPYYANFIDIDNDGDLDVFSNTYDYDTYISTVKFYKNTGDNTNVVLEEQFGQDNPFEGSFFHYFANINFTDIDNDGDFDAFILDENNYIYYYKNIGSAENPYFVRKNGSYNPLDAVNSSNMKKLSFADIDNDGDLDVFVGTNLNYPVLYRNTGDAENPAFISEDASSFFDTTFPSNLESMLMKDIDGDGDFDALINGNRYFENQGNETTPHFIEITGNSNPFNNIDNLGNNLPDLIDLDSDSDLDLLFGNYGDINYYKNTGNVNSAIFEDTNGGIDSAYYVMSDFVDIDNDGDYDMFAGVYNETSGYFKFAYYKNTGTSGNPVFEKQEWADNPLFDIQMESDIPTLKFVDIDNDGDQDLFTGSYRNDILTYYKNTGTPENPVFEEQVGTDNPLDGVGYVLSMDFADIDNDGDFDFFMGHGSEGLTFYRNAGTADNPGFEEETSPVVIPDTWRYLLPSFADIDNDGDLDFFTGAFDYDTYQWDILYAENKGTAENPDFEAQYGNANPLNLIMYLPKLSFVDIDNDGDKDVFIGTYPGQISYFKNKTVSAGIDATEAGNTLSVFPNPATDKIKVDLSSFNLSELQINIFDITGKLVSAKEMQNNTIDVSNLQSGIYFIKASDSKHGETTKLVIE